jgi:glycosyltransferase involved in cell wall biosynthesis
VTVPVQVVSGRARAHQAFLWRLLDLDEADGPADRPRDRDEVPVLRVRHPNKVVWLLHQFRQAYELRPHRARPVRRESPEDRATRRAVQRLDRVALGEARKLFATSRNVADRLERSTGVDAEVMPHPPQELRTAPTSYDDFVLSVGRLDRAKRIDLLIEALAKAIPALRVVIAATAPTASGSRARARHGLDGRASSPAASTTTSSPTSTRAASPSTTRRSTRTSGWCRTRRSSRRSRS